MSKRREHEMNTNSKTCPECQGFMTLVHGGKYSTVYVCKKCGVSLTVPPTDTVTPPKR
jgi:transposase-like protein